MIWHQWTYAWRSQRNANASSVEISRANPSWFHFFSCSVNFDGNDFCEARINLMITKQKYLLEFLSIHFRSLTHHQSPENFLLRRLIFFRSRLSSNDFQRVHWPEASLRSERSEKSVGDKSAARVNQLVVMEKLCIVTRRSELIVRSIKRFVQGSSAKAAYKTSTRYDLDSNRLCNFSSQGLPASPQWRD